MNGNHLSCKMISTEVVFVFNNTTTSLIGFSIWAFTFLVDFSNILIFTSFPTDAKIQESLNRPLIRTIPKALPPMTTICCRIKFGRNRRNKLGII